MNSGRRYSLAAGVVFGLAPLAGAEVWDATAAFSIQNGNPNGPWSYAWTDTGFSTLTLMPHPA